MKKNFKTPVEDILFRCSSIGLLVTGLINNDLTVNQRIEMKELQDRAASMIGLTAKQQEKLDSYNKDIADGKVLTDKKKAEKEDFEKRLVTPKGLTDNQEAQLQKLIDKDGAEPELSQGAKTYIKSVWLHLEKGFKENFENKFTSKGLQGEEDSINLVSFVDGIMYNKNTTRITRGHLTGECDINSFIKAIEASVIDDMKSSWNPRTFMAAELTSLYEWQGRGYMHLYDVDLFRLRYCLVDCPPDVYLDELKRFEWTNNIIDSSLEEYADLMKQFAANLLYTESGNYTQEERVKTFSIIRDMDKEKLMLKAIDMAVEYYKTITLNMIEE